MGATNRITQEERPPLPNGHTAQRVAPRVNGHAQEVAQDESATNNLAPQARAQAAADDAHGTPDAPASVPPAASANRADDAAAACDSNGSAEQAATPRHLTRSEKAAAKAAAKAARDAVNSQAAERTPTLQAGTAQLPADHHAFTEALHAKVDFLEVGKHLLNSSDEKIVKGVWEHMLELRYGKEAAPSESAHHIVIDVPRPRHNDPSEVSAATKTS
jgi:hypothetical protein